MDDPSVFVSFVIFPYCDIGGLAGIRVKHRLAFRVLANIGFRKQTVQRTAILYLRLPDDGVA
jgi:hypothetical protein